MVLKNQLLGGFSMIVKMRKSEDGKWCMLEKFERSVYTNVGYVKALVMIDSEGNISKPYVYRNKEFIPLKQIDEEMGISKYIKAKKPFYSDIRSGHLVELKAVIDFSTGTYLPDKSEYSVYVSDSIPKDVSKGVYFRKVLNVPKEFDKLVENPLKLLGESLGVRETFLRSRL